jgi:hypothetical protein
MKKLVLGAALAIVTAAPAIAQTASQLFTQGLSDRTRWETWYNGLSGDTQAGAGFWAGQRSLAYPGECIGDPAFELGCSEAKAILTESDIMRKAYPAYRAGWNGYGRLQTVVVPVPVTVAPPTAPAPTPPPTNVTVNVAAPPAVSAPTPPSPPPAPALAPMVQASAPTSITADPPPAPAPVVADAKPQNIKLSDNGVANQIFLKAVRSWIADANNQGDVDSTKRRLNAHVSLQFEDKSYLVKIEYPEDDPWLQSCRDHNSNRQDLRSCYLARDARDIGHYIVQGYATNHSPTEDHLSVRLRIQVTRVLDLPIYA